MSADALLKVLHKACVENYVSTVKDVVENQHCDPLATDEKGNTALNVAASSGSLNVLEYLIKIRNCSPECPGYLKRTPLHNACEKGGNLVTVKYLVENCRCNVFIKDTDGRVPLHIAAISGQLDILKYLIEQGNCDPECSDLMGRSPLYFACEKSLDMVKYLIEKQRCDPMRKMIYGDTPYNRAGFSDDSRVIKYLIEERELVNVAARGAWKRSLLHNACIKGNLETVRYLIDEHNLDPLDKDEDGFTPLDCATSSNHPHVIQYFVEMGYNRPQSFIPLLPEGSVTKQDMKTRMWRPEKIDGGGSVPWIHPKIQNESGTMTPGWCPVQKWEGNIVFLNKGTGAQIIEDPRAALKRYQLALKDGYVSVHLAKILIIGAAGVGKTHLLHQLFDEQLPDVRRSTPVMMRPVQSIQAVLHQDGSKFQKLTDAQLYELLGHSVNDNAKRKLHSPSTHSDSVHHGPETVSNINSSPLKKTSVMPDSHSISEVAENLVVPIAKTKDAEPLCELNWVYFIDSGGQPQFHQLLPAFLHNTNLNIFVLRLCDKFNDYPPTDYYDQEGACSFSSNSLLSTREILQCCAQATQTVDKDGKSRLIIVGTHRDLENTCDETRVQKNELLLQLFISSMKKYIMFCNFDNGEVIYPLNAKEPDEVDRDMIAKLREDILSITGSSETIDIPIRWLIFHQEVQALSKKNEVDVLSIEQCNEVGAGLNMQQDDTFAALSFFSNLNVILYYPEVLKDVVFVNSQKLLNIVTLIVSYVVFKKGCTRQSDPAIIKARSEGIISIQLLKLMKFDLKKDYKPLMIGPEDLMELLQHVKIVCKHNADYFMPSILKGVDIGSIETLLSQNPDSVAPCAIHYEDRWLECGTFAFLVTSLLSDKRWKLAPSTKPFGQLLCVHSNIIKMYYTSTIVTLVDFKSHIEIHVNDDVEICKDSCHEIILSILNACKDKPQIAFVCPCKQYERHVATFSPGTLRRNQVLCSKDQSKKFSISEVGTEPLVWIKGGSTASQTLCDIDKVLTEENIDGLFEVVKSSAPKWKEIGRQLGFKIMALDDIAEKRRNSTVDCLVELLSCWLKWAPSNHERPNQKTLAMVLRSQEVGEEALANKLGQHSFN